MTGPNIPQGGWLIHKAGRGWYRPNAQGYTSDTSQAGRFSHKDAMKHSHPNGPNGPRDGITIKHECEVQEYVRRDPAALAALPEVQALIAGAVVAVTHPGGWNPRYIAYAKDNGRGPAAQLEHDAKSPSGMMGFVRWVDRCLAIFKGQHPEAFTGGYLKDGSAFDAWLEGLIVPIFASDEDDLLRRADIMVGMLRMGEGIAFGSDADMIADLAAAIRKRGEG